MTGVEFAFKVLTVAGYSEAKDPETESDKDIAFDGNVLPRGVSHSGLDRTKHIEEADNQNQRGVLEQ